MNKKLIFIGGIHSRTGTTFMKRIITTSSVVTSVSVAETRIWEFITGMLPYLIIEEELYSPRVSSIKYLEFTQNIRNNFGDIESVNSTLDWFTKKISNGICNFPFRPPLNLVKPMQLDELRIILREFVNLLLEAISINPEKKYICEKTPNNSQYIDIICRVIPDSKKIIMLRHPVDIAISHINKDWGPNNIIEAAIYTKAYLQSWQEAIIGIADSNYMLVKIEKLISNPEKIISRVFDYIGIKVSKEVSKFIHVELKPQISRRELIDTDLLKATNQILSEQVNLLGYS